MGEGERAEARLQRRQLGIMVASLAAASLIIVLAWVFKQRGGTIAPAGGIAIAVVYVLSMALAFWRAHRLSDEVELRHTRRGLIAGFYFYFLVYPAWYFLWKGGLVIEPIHEALFAGMVPVVMVTYFWNKLRG